VIVYVESNFVLAIALGQEDAEPATTILEMAERGEVELVFPAPALSEPFSTVVQRGRERRRLRTSLNAQIRELERSQPHQHVVSMLRPITVALTDLERRETDLLEQTTRRLLAVGGSVGIDLPVFDQALTYQSRYGLSPLDALIYASVVSDLARRPPVQEKCFISKNRNDFGDPGIIAELQSYRCVYADSFASARTIIENWKRAS
jgi:predicted nucleic acid-binding protein